MRLLALLLFCFSLSANAQNWALLNPAYKYNYSNDGTDTISNQIRVMQVDTLGPDSFRYELNRIGVVCDTCPASLGGPCDGCYVRVDQPQFLGYECLMAGGDWVFHGTDTFLIRSDASVGTTWSFNSSAGITATVDAEWSDSTFTIPDTLRRILLSSGDTLVISNSFGISRFEQGGDRVDLLGVEGAGVGRLFPEPLAYFDYQSGDKLTYWVSSVYYVDPPGGMPYYISDDHYWNVAITGRTGTSDSVEYTTSVARTLPTLMDLDDECIFPMPSDSWLFFSDDVLDNHIILGAYPGQILDETICFVDTSNFGIGYLARSEISDNGQTVMCAQVLRQIDGAPGGGINIAQTLAPNLFPAYNSRVNVVYEEGIGLRLAEFIPSPGIIELRIELVGAVIDGDTIIPPPVINWHVGMTEEHNSDITIFPNPTTEVFTVNGITEGRALAVFDLEGRLVRTARISSENETINVRDLQAGVYLLRIEGLRPQRFIIAR